MEPTPQTPSPEVAESLKRVRVRHFRRAKEQGIKITGLTSYDFLSATIFDRAGIDFLLVGDSAGNAVFGEPARKASVVIMLVPKGLGDGHSDPSSLMDGRVGVFNEKGILLPKRPPSNGSGLRCMGLFS